MKSLGTFEYSGQNLSNCGVNFETILRLSSALMKICHIPHVIFQSTNQFFSNFVSSLFRVVKDNFSVFFYVKRYILCAKGTNESGKFKNFEYSGQNSPSSCNFLTTNQFFF